MNTNVGDLHAVYGSKLPASIEKAVAHVTGVLEGRDVREVRFHANFSFDEDASLLYGSAVTKGLVVVAPPTLQLKPEDVAWLPSQLLRGRSVFEIPEGAPAELSARLPTLNASVGVYETRFVDDIGVNHTDTFLVVDATANDVVQAMHDRWLTTGMTLGAAYEELTTATVQQRKIAQVAREARATIAREVLGEAGEIYTDTMHNIYSDKDSLYVANGVVKHEGNVLQRVSSLGGFMEIQDPTRTFVPADSPQTLSAFQGWDQLSEAHLRRIFQDCSWDDAEAFNTQVLSAPMWNAAQRKNALDLYCNATTATPWHMRRAKFSSQGIRDLLPAETLLKLTPTSAPAFAPPGARAGATVSIPIDPAYALFQRVMAQPASWGAWKPFNAQVLDGEYLRVPREIIESL